MRVVEEPMARVAELGSVSIAFMVDIVFDVLRDGRVEGSDTLVARKLECPYLKNYDAMSREGPSTWARRFDVTNWGLLSAYSDGERVGGAVVACNTSGLDMLEGRADLAMLWDIRVAPAARGQGIGTALFRSVEEWATSRRCRQLKIETQNINVAACRFYERMGCELRGVDRLAYPGLPGEIQLLWYKELGE